MCLAVPGKVVQITKIDQSPTGLIGIVDFGGNQVEVSLSLVSEVKIGDFVLVHAGYALEILDEQEAIKTWDSLEQAGLEIEKPL